MKGGSSLKTPVVIIGFNRPDLLSSVLSNRNLADRRVYISIDGPRIEEEANVVQESIKVASAYLEIHPAGKLQFSSINLGCRRGVTAAIDWAFSFEESLIILEDDIVPSDFFFYFINERYVFFFYNLL
jgi:GT2 family glycosyltransferase